MDFKEQMAIKGALSIVVTDETGSIKQELHVPNLVVTVGKEYIASRMVGTASDVMSHMAIGTGSSVPEAANTVLGIEAGRVALSSFSATSNAVTATASFPAGTGTGELTEAGIFNDDTTGAMLCRTTFPVVNKQAGDSIAITWVITVS